MADKTIPWKGAFAILLLASAGLIYSYGTNSWPFGDKTQIVAEGQQWYTNNDMGGYDVFSATTDQWDSAKCQSYCQSKGQIICDTFTPQACCCKVMSMPTIPGTQLVMQAKLVGCEGNLIRASTWNIGSQQWVNLAATCPANTICKKSAIGKTFSAYGKDLSDAVTLQQEMVSVLCQ